MKNTHKRKITKQKQKYLLFKQIKIQTCLAPQNDHLNLSFVKDENTVGEKMARNGPKWPFILSDSFPIRV